MIHLTSQSFEQKIDVKDTLIVVDFWASWCGPCKMLAPIFEELSNEMTDVKFCKVNVDEEPELSNQFKVNSIPSLFFIKNGTVVDMSVGYMGKEQLKAKIEANK